MLFRSAHLQQSLTDYRASGGADPDSSTSSSSSSSSWPSSNKFQVSTSARRMAAWASERTWATIHPHAHLRVGDALSREADMMIDPRPPLAPMTTTPTTQTALNDPEANVRDTFRSNPYQVTLPRLTAPKSQKAPVQNAQGGRWMTSPDAPGFRTSAMDGPLSRLQVGPYRTAYPHPSPFQDSSAVARRLWPEWKFVLLANDCANT
ncbi:hypothetical protein DFH06DRAFT_1328249 [Mycena polygramma]|nr:hypothetical protein DFH06DRAFT_1328249 [Mycena polygramma]